MTDAVNSGNLANFGLVDKAEEARNREVVHEYLNFLDDSVNYSIFSKITVVFPDHKTILFC